MLKNRKVFGVRTTRHGKWSPVTSQHSQFELEDVGRNGIKRRGGHITQALLFDLDSSTFVVTQLGT